MVLGNTRVGKSATLNKIFDEVESGIDVFELEFMVKLQRNMETICNATWNKESNFERHSEGISPTRIQVILQRRNKHQVSNHIKGNIFIMKPTKIEEIEFQAYQGKMYTVTNFHMYECKVLSYICWV